MQAQTNTQAYRHAYTQQGDIWEGGKAALTVTGVNNGHNSYADVF